MKRFPVWIATITVMLLALALGALPAAAADAVVGNGTPASCNEAALDAAISTVQASGSGTVTFNCGPETRTIEVFTSANIKTEVVIDGGDKVRLLAQGSAPLFVRPRFFEVSDGGALTLRDIILEGGTGPAGDGWGSQGGSIVVWSASSLDVQSSTILDSVSTAWGGAIANEGGAVRVQDSVISGSAKWGGAYNGANGFDIFINATVTGSTSQEGGGGLRFWNALDSQITDSTISGNQTNGAGGGVENIGGRLTIQGSIIEENLAAEWGGGIKNSNNPGKTGTVEIEKSRVADNTAGLNGGGIDNAGGLLVSETLVTRNGAGWGGGILSWGGTLILDRATITENKADAGGGLYVHGGGATIDESLIDGNEATNGGGLFLTEIDGSTAANWVAITSSTISGNQTTQAGGGILANRAYVTVSKTEIAGNQATAVYLWKTASGGSYMTATQSSVHDNTGGGFYNGEQSTLTLFNTTVSQNGEWGVWAGLDSVYTGLGFSTVRGNADGQMQRTGGRLSLESSAVGRGSTAKANCVTNAGLPALEGDGSWSDDNSCGSSVSVSADLDLGPLALNGGATPNHLPQPGSILIDATDCGTVTIDQRGAARPQGAACDAGAVEVGIVGGRLYAPVVIR